MTKRWSYKRWSAHIAAKYGDFDTRVKRIVDAYNEWRSTGDRTPYVLALRFEAILGVEEKARSGRRDPNPVLAACRELIPDDSEEKRA